MTLSIEMIVEDKRYFKEWGLPNSASEKAAGIDLRAAIEEPIAIPPGACVLIPTGIKIFIKDENLAGFIYPRSGLGHKQGLVLGNGTGIIDADYQGELKVSLFNRNPAPFPIDVLNSLTKEIPVIQPGDRIAQLVIQHIVPTTYSVVAEFSDSTKRGEGGFGSTGVST